MKSKDITYYRLQQQHILNASLEQPAQVVKWFGAVQAQDYLGALWAIGLRTKNSTEKIVEDAFVRKTIIRTWPMRGTLHFVCPENVRWMLKLLAPRIVAAQAKRLKRDYDLDDKVISRAEKAIVRALEGNLQCQREALYKVLERAKIAVTGERGLHILWRLAQEGVLCFGTREGKQHTFVLLDEWIPATKTLSRNESLAKLASIYFTSHGPATVQDFGWWSGLSSADARIAYELIKSDFSETNVDGQEYIVPHNTTSIKHSSSTFLLPSYDEYTVGYSNRTAVLDFDKETNHGNGIFKPILVVNGKITGTWTRTLKRDGVSIELKCFSPLNKTQKKAVEDNVDQYRKFLAAKTSSLRFIK